jgi:DNA-binding NtrC family response regulator
LRQRKADIPMLAEHFLRLHCRRRNKEVAQISAAVMDLLLQHDWPGNVRELSNAIERAVVLAEGEEILPDHLLHYGVVGQYAVETGSEHVVALSESERMHIEKALQESRGNKSLAARMLGIDRKTLWRKLRQYNRQPAP